MFEKLPAIYCGAETTTVLTAVHDHSREAVGHYGVVKCDDLNCRAEMINRLGGIEMVSRKWFFALGEEMEITIAQGGMKNLDGSPFCHIHEPHGKDHAIECDSPDCNRFFADDWSRYQILKASGQPGRAVASPIEKDRPKSIAQLDEERALMEEGARRAAAIEMEVRRQTVAQLWPLPR
ncbi:MAG TPA: hypothetical protein VNZ26_25765 [Vicinamibacterales bacterium]|jgi:hypothetical protein|nr:hypothetical protein [Vicinamibacterales bacterium]